MPDLPAADAQLWSSGQRAADPYSFYVGAIPSSASGGFASPGSWAIPSLAPTIFPTDLQIE